MIVTMLVIRLLFSPAHPCIHELDGRRPRVTHTDQAHTERVLAHVIDRLGASRDFHQLLHLVATREASLHQGLVHRLPADVEASSDAFNATHRLYPRNPYRADKSAWQTYGLFGMNSNYYTVAWSSTADPHVLCDPIVDVLVYRRAAANILRRAGKPIRCVDAGGEAFKYRPDPTWATIHRTISRGSLCPGDDSDFRRAARRRGVDPDRVVTLRDLGAEPAAGLDGAAWTNQYDVLAGLWCELGEGEGR